MVFLPSNRSCLPINFQFEELKTNNYRSFAKDTSVCTAASWEKHGWGPYRWQSEITSTLFTSNVAEVANGLSKERCLPAALGAWSTIERSVWTEVLIRITTTQTGKQPVSEQTVSHGAAFSCSGFPTGNPDEASVTYAELNNLWEDFTKRCQIRQKLFVTYIL